MRSRAWAIVGALSVTETVSWGVLYYAFAVFLLPMERELGFSAAELTGAFSLALLVSAVVGIGVGRYLDRRSPRGLMTLGSIAGAILVAAWSRVMDWRPSTPCGSPSAWSWPPSSTSRPSPSWPSGFAAPMHVAVP